MSSPNVMVFRLKDCLSSFSRQRNRSASLFAAVTVGNSLIVPITSLCRAVGRLLLRSSGTPTSCQLLSFLCKARPCCSGQPYGDRDSNDPPLRLVTTSFSMSGIYLSAKVLCKL